VEKENPAIGTILLIVLLILLFGGGFGYTAGATITGVAVMASVAGSDYVLVVLLIVWLVSGGI